MGRKQKKYVLFFSNNLLKVLIPGESFCRALVDRHTDIVSSFETTHKGESGNLEKMSISIDKFLQNLPIMGLVVVSTKTCCARETVWITSCTFAVYRLSTSEIWRRRAYSSPKFCVATSVSFSIAVLRTIPIPGSGHRLCFARLLTWIGGQQLYAVELKKKKRTTNHEIMRSKKGKE